jgi:Asp-tRNA(Asn)/Glu-tRNA(Gln) amidotransferase A subunit family amidase
MDDFPDGHSPLRADRLVSNATQQSASSRVEALLARIERLDPQLRAFITVTGDQALATAHACDAAAADGRSLGPLHGLVIAVKDCIDIAGRGEPGARRSSRNASRPRMRLWCAACATPAQS